MIRSEGLTTHGAGEKRFFSDRSRRDCYWSWNKSSSDKTWKELNRVVSCASRWPWIRVGGKSIQLDFHRHVARAGVAG